MQNKPINIFMNETLPGRTHFTTIMHSIISRVVVEKKPCHIYTFYTHSTDNEHNVLCGVTKSICIIEFSFVVYFYDTQHSLISFIIFFVNALYIASPHLQ